MKRTKIVVSSKALKHYTASLLVFIASGDGKKIPLCDRFVNNSVKKLFKLGDFKGKQKETILIYPDNGELSESLQSERILLTGLGEIKKNQASTKLTELLRCAGGCIAGIAAKVRTENIIVVLPEYLKEVRHNGSEQLIEGILLGDYRFNKYKKEDNENNKFTGIKKITLHGGKNLGAIRKAVKRAQKASEAVAEARDMANEPGNNWKPQDFADFARNLAKTSSLKCRVLDKNQIKKAGMGGIIAVNQGSAIPPKLVILEHVPKSYCKTILLVGKGVTFDSGGISLKPAAGMQEMKYDMCGGAAVLAAMQVICWENPDVKVVAIVPATDNMSGEAALKPGDIIKHYNGITSEVVNTDAEGRLILADALAYGIKKYKPDWVIDLATLTGAVIVGLGHHRTGLMSNNDELAQKILDSGEACGEPLWRLPLGEEYSKQIESEVADIKNVGGKGAGSITAAAYLQKFVGETPWAHLDIAGTAWDFTKKSYIPKGPSGVGVRTLIDFIRNWKAIGK